MFNYSLCSADRTPDFNGSLFRTDCKSSDDLVLFLYLKNTVSEKNGTMKCSEFSDLLKLQNLSKLKSYLNNHRLSESDEYQMVVTLAMDLEDERKAEKIICDYIRRYGLSPKAKQALIDLNFTSALKLLCSLNAEPEEIVDLCSDEISIAQRLKDGFLMLSDDEITEEFC